MVGSDSFLGGGTQSEGFSGIFIGVGCVWVDLTQLAMHFVFQTTILNTLHELSQAVHAERG